MRRMTKKEYDSIISNRYKLVLRNIYTVIRHSLESDYKTIDIIYKRLPSDSPFHIERFGFFGNRVYCPDNYNIGNIVTELRKDGYNVRIANLNEYKYQNILYRIIL